ncbi:alpha/beta hydrolase [Ramlibacter albus]|uniref:Alpha/beta fold hydrolase n=1 Tax=Ramlibacter albus TaxID=2079448 RepID=A0A923M6V9_9BURK|nr:alpha/beta hydrolase [Ramlibacter albus]MBC5763814.1 alpha/beta fold hydrolase [Ramlibacter albus]
MDTTATTTGTLQAASRFYDASPALRLFRFALKTAERLWPAFAVRAAYRVFGTPLPLRWVRRPNRLGKDWRAEAWPFEDGGVTVYSPAAAPHGPVALLVHGWGGNAGQMVPLAETLGQHGLRPVLVDLPAHGASAGSVSNLPQFARAIEYVVARLMQQGFEVRALVAHSLGANAAAFAVARNLPVRRLVLLAPPASARAYTSYFAHVFGLSETTRAAMQKRIEVREGILITQFEPPAVGPRVNVPTLIVHDRDDRINAFSDGQAFARHVRGADLLATQGLGHRRILKDAQVLGRVAIFTV